ncbi:O-antigen ligase family protein [Thiobacter aerophilum]|uniref:O-antigen ligase family protein n=1 Tax=Thiobacter aerophilum TaxID=3121275 RepID=A0ABV0ED23_9BURK
MPAPAVWCLAFLLWALLQAFFFAPGRSQALSELWGQWGPAIAAGFFGWALGLRAAREDWRETLWRALTLVLLVHAVATLWTAATPLFTGHALLRRVGGLTEGPDKSNYLTVTLACLLLAALAARPSGRAQRLFPTWAAALMAPVALATLYVEQIRNGLVSLAVALAGLTIFLLTGPQFTPQAKRLVFAAFLLGGVALGALLASDSRWQGTLQSARLAWHADTRAVVLGESLPSGGDPSAYLRLAMLKEGLRLVAEHPLGIGFGRNAFGHGLNMAYGQGSGHSHSSLLDISIGTGVPGALLIVICFLSLIQRGWHAARRRADTFGLLLFLLACATFARSLLDSNLRDHMLQQSLFLFGILLALTDGRLHPGATRS